MLQVGDRVRVISYSILGKVKEEGIALVKAIVRRDELLTLCEVEFEGERGDLYRRWIAESAKVEAKR